MSVTLEVHLEQAGLSEIRCRARTHQLTVDRPTAKGGTDMGPLGGEFLLIGLAGCFLSNLLAAVRAREADVRNVHVRATGVVDGPPERFVEATLYVSADYTDEALLRKLTTIAESACLVTNTLRDTVRISVLLEHRHAVEPARA